MTIDAIVKLLIKRVSALMFASIVAFVVSAIYSFNIIVVKTPTVYLRDIYLYNNMYCLEHAHVQSTKTTLCLLPTHHETEINNNLISLEKNFSTIITLTLLSRSQRLN